MQNGLKYTPGPTTVEASWEETVNRLGKKEILVKSALHPLGCERNCLNKNAYARNSKRKALINHQQTLRLGANEVNITLL